MKTLKSNLVCSLLNLACSQIGFCAFIVGSVDPGSPASPSAETGYVNFLLSMGANQTTTSGGKQYITGSYDASVVTLDNYLKFDPPSNTASVTGYQFVLGKFGNESWLWELGINETFVLPQNFSDINNAGGGISHYSVFNSTPNNSVPDAGSTIVCLGVALFGLGSMKKLSILKV
jgi:hypothetical protein